MSLGTGLSVSISDYVEDSVGIIVVHDSATSFIDVH